MSIYGKHFDQTQWDAWTAANDTENGVCEFCGVAMGPARGIPKHQRLQFHILRRCPRYRNRSERPAAAASTTSTPPRAAASTTSTPPRAAASTTSTPPRAASPQPALSMESRPAATMPRSAPAPTAPPVEEDHVRLKPKPVNCKKKLGTCSYKVAWDQHYNQKQWDIWAECLKNTHAQTPIDEEY